MNAKAYLSLTGLPASLQSDDLLQAGAVIAEKLKDARAQSVPATPRALNVIYQYQVPTLSPDGSCSLVDQLEPAPYDLGAMLGGRAATNTICLLALNGLVELVATQLNLAWLGVYQLRATDRGPVAVKLAFCGRPSRPEYPLTEAFAARSNIVAVARTGKARLVQDVPAHLAQGGAYYQCDPAMRSEACLPVYGDDGTVVGLVDAEHSSEDYFIVRRLAWLVALALAVPLVLPPGSAPVAPPR